MGDRGSIQVICKENNDISVVLFRHWQGCKESMIELCKNTKKEFISNRGSNPFCQVSEIIARMTKIAVEEDGYSSYLGKNEDDGDNSDNGHFILYVEMDKARQHGKWTLVQGKWRKEI